MKNVPLSIRLELKKSILFEATSREITENITIGRAKDCTWQIPLEDALASGHHAVITHKKSRLYICDTGSRNGIFIKGQRITEKALQPGDSIAIGDCLLIVEKAVVKKTGGVNRVQILSGPDSGKVIELLEQNYVIGSAPGSDILLMNQLVSRKHAEIAVRPDGCWITDAGGKNGTLVNGSRLKAGTERLLKDSDIISIAQFDLKYLDAAVAHTQSRLWHSLLIMSVTALVVLAGYYAYIRANPSAFDKLKDARSAAAVGDFNRAETLLIESRNCRGADDCRLRGDELKRDIENWRSTTVQWSAIRGHLNGGRWTDAAYGLGMVDPAQLHLWSWNNSDAAESRKQAMVAKQLLDAFLSARNSAQSDDTPLELLRNRAAMLGKALEESRKQKLNFLTQLNTQVEKLFGELNAEISGHDRVDQIVARLAENDVPYDSIIADLEEMRKKSRGALRLKIEKLLLPIRTLKKSYGELLTAVKNITDMRFGENISKELTLPPLEQCLVNPNIANLRRRQNETFLSLRDAATRLNLLCQALNRCEINDSREIPPHIGCFFDDKIMAELYRCDVLDKPMPSRMRTAPAGQYDRLLGMEAFYTYLYSLPAEFDPSAYDELSFKPQIILARESFQKMEELHSFLARDRNILFCRGKLAGFRSFTNSLLQRRSELVKKLSTAPLNTREGMIANGIALFLAGSGDVPADAPERYMKALKAYRKPLMLLNNEFSTASPERALQIRDEIMKRGLPGDPIVRKMWSKR